MMLWSATTAKRNERLISHNQDLKLNVVKAKANYSVENWLLSVHCVAMWTFWFLAKWLQSQITLSHWIQTQIFDKSRWVLLVCVNRWALWSTDCSCFGDASLSVQFSPCTKEISSGEVLFCQLFFYRAKHLTPCTRWRNILKKKY